jgi:hypothetical protein
MDKYIFSRLKQLYLSFAEDVVSIMGFDTLLFTFAEDVVSIMRMRG